MYFSENVGSVPVITMLGVVNAVEFYSSVVSVRSTSCISTVAVPSCVVGVFVITRLQRYATATARRKIAVRLAVSIVAARISFPPWSVDLVDYVLSAGVMVFVLFFLLAKVGGS